MTRLWTEREVFILEEGVGSYSFNAIAKRVKRTPYAVERKLVSMGMVGTKSAGGWLSARQLAEAVSLDPHVIARWRNNHGLPMEDKRITYDNPDETHVPTYRITVERFWRWAKKNKELLNFSKVDESILLPIPEWYYAERKKDAQEIPRRRLQKWTTAEDHLLLDMYYKKAMLQREIAPVLNRSVNAVEKRIKRLREMKVAKV